jgi:hypothetical protein
VIPLEARCSYLFLVSAVCLKFFVVLVPILVSSVIFFRLFPLPFWRFHFVDGGGFKSI